MATNGQHMMDITNILISPISNETKKCEDLNPEGLWKEIGLLRKAILKKDATIESQNREIQQLRLRNRELARNNNQLFREHAVEVDKATVLAHECSQMSTVFKVVKSELEQKVRNLSDQVEMLLRGSTKAIVPSKNMDSGNPRGSSKSSTNQLPCGKRSGLRSRSTTVNYSEPLLARKLKRSNPENGNLPASSRRAPSSRSSKALRTVLEICEDSVESENYENVGPVLDIEPLQVSLDELMLEVEPHSMALAVFEGGGACLRRSTRKAAATVSSYKECAVNCKMRRVV